MVVPVEPGCGLYLLLACSNFCMEPMESMKKGDQHALHWDQVHGGQQDEAPPGQEGEQDSQDNQHRKFGAHHLYKNIIITSFIIFIG